MNRNSWEDEIYESVLKQIKNGKNNSSYYRITVDFHPNQGIDLVLSLVNAEEGELLTAIAQVHQIYSTLQKQEDDIRRRIAEEALTNYNENWNQEPDKPIDIEEFMSHMELREIYISNDGRSSLSYQVGDLFSDHMLITELNAQYQIEYLDIAG